MPKISVIVPVFNVEQYLKFSITSILDQTFNDFEIILVNDGSTDNSLNECLNLAKQDSRIRVFNKTNGGLSSARNYGIHKASGKYICFFDSDDFIHPQFLELLVNEIEKTGADVVFCDWLKFNNLDSISKNLVSYSRVSVKEVELKLFMKLSLSLVKYSNCNGCYVWNKLFRKDLFDYVHFEKTQGAEDELFTVSIAPFLKKIIYVNFIGYFYRYREDSLSNRPSFPLHFLYTRFKLMQQPASPFVKPLLRAAYVLSVVGYAGVTLKYGFTPIKSRNLHIARFHAKKAISLLNLNLLKEIQSSSVFYLPLLLVPLLPLKVQRAFSSFVRHCLEYKKKLKEITSKQ